MDTQRGKKRTSRFLARFVLGYLSLGAAAYAADRPDSWLHAPISYDQVARTDDVPAQLIAHRSYYLADDPPAPMGPPAVPSEAAGEAGEGGEVGSDTTFGPEPEEPARQRTQVQTFLRSESVLLRPGEWQFDYGLVYSYSHATNVVAVTDGGGNIIGVANGRFRRRVLYSPFELRYGVADRVQAFVNLPVGWANSEFSFTGFDQFDDRFGIGDTSFGFSYLLKKSECGGCCCCSPDVVVTFAATAPTSDVDMALVVGPPDASLGQGYWALGANILFTQRCDPLLFFWGAGYRHLFERSFDGVRSQPGEQISYYFGAAFSVNECVTLTTSFLGMYISEQSLNGFSIDGTIQEPMRLRFSALLARGGNRLMEPFAEIGMTETAPNARIGIVWTH